MPTELWKCILKYDVEIDDILHIEKNLNKTFVVTMTTILDQSEINELHSSWELYRTFWRWTFIVTTYLVL